MKFSLLTPVLYFLFLTSFSLSFFFSLLLFITLIPLLLSSSLSAAVLDRLLKEKRLAGSLMGRGEKVGEGNEQNILPADQSHSLLSLLFSPSFFLSLSFNFFLSHTFLFFLLFLSLFLFLSPLVFLSLSSIFLLGSFCLSSLSLSSLFLSFSWAHSPTHPSIETAKIPWRQECQIAAPPHTLRERERERERKREREK